MRDLGKMMKQVQKLQQDVARLQEELKAERVEATAGGGVVRAVANGTVNSRRSRSTRLWWTRPISVCSRTSSSLRSAKRSAWRNKKLKSGCAASPVASRCPPE